MLSLNLNKIRTAQERFEQVYSPEQFGSEQDFRVVEPIALAFDIFKDKDQFRLVGRVRTRLELACGRGLGPSTLAGDQNFRRGDQPPTRITGRVDRETR